MYRILDAKKRSRTNQRHPAYTRPELLAVQVWSWDITKLKGPRKWTYFYLYVILDIFRKRSWEPSRRDKYGRERPPRLTAPAVKKGGSLPSNPSPLARLGLSGLAPKARVKPAGRGVVSVDTLPLDL